VEVLISRSDIVFRLFFLAGMLFYVGDASVFSSINLDYQLIPIIPPNYSALERA
jgi:hypothetical protein